MRLSSYTRSFLSCVWSDRASLRRVVRAFAAARRRWPSGRVVVRLSGWVVVVEFVVPVGVVPPGSDMCGLLLQLRR